MREGHVRFLGNYLYNAFIKTERVIQHDKVFSNRLLISMYQISIRYGRQIIYINV